MILRLFVLCAVLLATQSAWSQIYPNKPFKVKLVLGEKKTRGLLLMATDSLVVVGLKSKGIDIISYHEMERIYVRRKGSIGRKAARGFGWGAVVGTVFGLLIAAGKDPAEDSFFSDSDGVMMAAASGAI